MSRNKSTKNQSSAIATIFAVSLLAILLPLLNLTPLLDFLLLLLFLTILVLLINPKWGLFAIILLRPTLDFSSNLTIFEIGPLSINLASLLGLLLIPVVIMIAAKKKNLLKKIPLLKNWILFLVVLSLSMLISFNKTASISELIRFISIFSLFILGSITIRNKNDLLQIILISIISMVIPSLVALYQLVNNTGLTLSYQDVPNRLFGTFAHPNLFAFSLTLSIALSLAMFLKNKNTSIKFLYGFAFLSYSGLLALTYTRGAWILFIFMIISAGILKLRKLLIISTLIFFCLYLTVGPVKDRINSITTLSPYSSITWRFNLWRDSFEYIKEAPILGHGTGTSEELIKIRRGSFLGSTAPHNDFLKILLENGIFGIIAFLGIFFVLSKKLFLGFSRNSSSEYSILVLIFFCFTIGLYAASFGDNILEATALQWSFWPLAAGFLVSCKPSKQS